MKKTIAILLSAVLLVSMLSIAVSAASWKNEADWTVINEEGDVAFPNAYGYVFDINYVNGVIGGEDATIIDNADAYAASNPNWAISVALKATETDGVYSVIKVVETPGSAAAAGINWLETSLVMVVHSATSNPAEAASWPNWKSKVAALALKAGDLVKYEGTTVTVQNEDGTFPEAPAEDEESKEDESDAPATEKVLKNVAEGKDYTIGNSGFGHIVSGGDWPCNYNADLTDGVASEMVTYDDKWFAFAIYESDNGFNVVDGKGSVTVDLGEATDIASVSANIGVALDAGVAAPAKAEVFVSNDGENFESVGELAAVTETGWADLAYEGNARYVKIEFTVAAGAGFVFIDEVAVNGYVEVPVEDTPDAGDASSMIVFAIIALVALAGSAVVVKTRR